MVKGFNQHCPTGRHELTKGEAQIIPPDYKVENGER